MAGVEPTGALICDTAIVCGGLDERDEQSAKNKTNEHKCGYRTAPANTEAPRLPRWGTRPGRALDGVARRVRLEATSTSWSCERTRRGAQLSRGPARPLDHEWWVAWTLADGCDGGESEEERGGVSVPVGRVSRAGQSRGGSSKKARSTCVAKGGTVAA
eukprot:5843671-Amphidinium_carterae.1